MKRKKRGERSGKPQVPDEVFSAGPLQMARYGKYVVSKASWRPGEFDEYQRRFAGGYSEIVQKIDDAIAEASALVATLNPLRLLHRAWWERSAAHLLVDSEVDVHQEHALAARMLDYVQSLVAGTPPKSTESDELTDEAWANLQRLVDSVFQTLNSEYFLSARAKRRIEHGVVNDAFESFHYLSQLYWCNVTGDQYQNHQVQSLRELLEPQSEVIEQLYGLTSYQLCDELSKIWHALTKGRGEAHEEMAVLQEKCMDALESDIASGVAGEGDMGELLRASIVRNGQKHELDRVLGRTLFYDLFDLQKVATLPLAFLEDFSWSPGQDSEFFADGAFKGWPLRVWPTFKRPFIKLNERFYCFDLSSLFDHFYRQIEKRAFAANKQLKQRWIDARKEVTETLPFTYLLRLLPGSACFRSAYYWMGEEGKPANRFETDGYIAFDDHLFIIEVKAGAFTYTSPATDVEAHLQSLKNLVTEPAKQGSRFLQYLLSAPEVPILSEVGKEIARIRLQDYRHVTVCAVTLDPFTEIAAQVQHLPAIGVGVGDLPIWLVSLDDLRVYADIFSSPLEFLHFVEQRKEAFKSSLLQLDDELDHLGLYLEHNYYAIHAAKLADGKKVKLQFVGYRAEIDKFFKSRLLEPERPSPFRQKMPRGMAELLDFLQGSEKKGRSAIASYLLNIAGDWRQDLFETLSTELRQAIHKRPRPYSTMGDVRLTVVPLALALGGSVVNMRDHVRAMMIMNNEPDRVLLELSYHEDGHLVDADWQFLRLAEIPIFELPRLRDEAESLRAARLQKAVDSGKSIGRNDQCPCGSTKKFKKCCLVRR